MERTLPVQEERFEYKGFPCVVLFQTMGFRTGYVGVPKGHKYYGEDCDNIPIDCHCGLTYSSSHLCHQSDTYVWWIGFDCGHYCDGYDFAKVKQYFSDNKEVMEQLEYMQNYCTPITLRRDFKTLEYVKAECMNIVEQLLESEE